MNNMIRLWSGFYKPLSMTERSSSHVILHEGRFHAAVPKAGDIVHVDKSGYFKIVGKPKYNDRNDWFDAKVGRRVKTKEVRQRTRQKYQLMNLRNWYAMCERNGDTDDLEIIDRHIEMCTKDNTPDAALVGWVRCMENVSSELLDQLEDERMRVVELEEVVESSVYDTQIEELDYTMEAVTELLDWKHPGLCAHAWDCDD